MTTPSLSLNFQNTHVLVTGGAGLIGRSVVSHFLSAGARVSSLDIAPQPPSKNANLTPIHCDISSEDSTATAFSTARDTYGPVEICIALASLDACILTPSTSFAEASFSQLKKVLEVNVAGTWLTAREWLRGLTAAKDADMRLEQPCLVIVGSESGHFGVRQFAEYSLGKSAVQGGLLMSLRAEVPRVWRGARVNVVAPGAVATEKWDRECEERPEQYWEEAQATVCFGS
jgi:NAD(P)-dependent dehydrogenase (short-subunit alcohol dehydrogenase family)